MFKRVIPLARAVFWSGLLLLLTQSAGAQVLAVYSATPTNGTSPLTVQFTGPSTASGNPISAWSWNFGDGTTSTNQSPLHTYVTNANFHPTLLVTYNVSSTVSGTGPSTITVGPKFTFSLTTSSLTNSRSYATATLLQNGLVLVAGGQTSNSVILASAELFNPATGKWTVTGSLHQGREYHTATLLTNGQVLVAGGAGSSGYLASAELYNPSTGTWTVTGSLNTARIEHTANLLTNGTVLVAGGQNSGGSLTSAEIFNPNTGTWTTTGAMHTARFAHTATMLSSGKVLAAGGYSTVVESSTEIYNPNTGTWATNSPMTSPRFLHTATLLGTGKILVTGGGNGVTPVSSAELYTSSNSTWASTGSMLTARDAHSATLLPNGNVLVTGGQTSSSTTATAELYDTTNGVWGDCGLINASRSGHTATWLPTGQLLLAGGNNGIAFLNSSEVNIVNTNYPPGAWTLTNSMANVRHSHTLTLLATGQALAAGGTGNSTDLNTSELYSPSTGTWTNTSVMNYGRTLHTATLLTSGLVLVAGGSSNSVLVSTTELFNPSGGTWTTSSDLNTPRQSHTASLLTNGLVLVAGGDNSGALSSTEVYNPQTQTWNYSGTMATPRYDHTATVLTNGLVLVAGGFSSSWVGTAELYNPATGLWTNTGSLNVARYGHTATLLANGQVLVAGGVSSNTSGLTSVEIYNPVTGLWTLTGSLANGRYSHTATLLHTGNVVVTGGFQNSGVLNTTEIYHPELGAWVTSGALNVSRYDQAAALMPGGLVLVCGGANTLNGDLSSAELFDGNYGFIAGSAVPQISSATPLYVPNGTLGISGTSFRGSTEGSSGNGTSDSPEDYPLVQLHSIAGGQTMFLPCSNWLSTSFVSRPITNFPLGYAILTVMANGIVSDGTIIDVASPYVAPSIIAGFGTGSGWTLNNGATISNGVLTLTTGPNQSKSAFFNIPQDINTFTATFTWQNSYGVGSNNPDDGIVFAVENQGPTAVSTVGGGLGYQGISPASGVAFNASLTSPGVQYAPLFSGNGFQSVSPVNLHSNHPISVVVACTNSVITVGTFDVASSNGVFATNLYENLAGDAGGTPAYIGFTAGSISGTSVQTISNFVFVPAGAGAPSTGSIINGGFETGDLTGWTQVGNTLVSVVSSQPHSGTYSASLGGVVTPAILSQAVSTVPGQTYLLSFWLNSPDGYLPNEFYVSWNGQPLLVESELPAFGWTNYQFQVTATGASSTLKFAGVDYNSYLYLDDVQLQPEYVQFTATPTHGLEPLTVQFTAPSTDSAGQGIASWAWDFGDGTTTNGQNPSHVYTGRGAIYAPTLIVNTSVGGTIPGFGPEITVDPPSLAIQATPSAGPSPLTVQFTSPITDNYGDTITNWNWDMGDDSGFPTNQNPIYTYNYLPQTFFPDVTVTDKFGNVFVAQAPIINMAPYNGVVQNGGFEAVYYNSYITGWTLSGDTVNCLVDNGSVTPISPNSGSGFAALQTVLATGTISQNLKTVPGSNYLVSFAFNSPTGNTPNKFQGSWNGATFFSATNIITGGGWSNYQYFLTATGTNTPLQFTFQNQNGYFGLDDVSAVLSSGISATVTAPLNGAAFTTNQIVPISASAVGLHSIQSIAIYTNGGFIASVNSNSINATLGLAAGSYAITAVATDVNNNSVTSAPVHITVNVPGTQLIDFEAVDASQGALTSPGLDNYLANYGVTEAVGPGNAAPAIVNVANLSGATASSGVNILTEVGTNGGTSYTLYFANPCTKVSWVRTAMLASGGGIVTPAWTAYAFDPYGNEIAQIGENQISSTTNIPAANFFLEGTNIAWVTFAANNNLSSLLTLPLDDLLLSTNPTGTLPKISITASNFDSSAPGGVSLNATASETGGAIQRIDFYDNQLLTGSIINLTPGSPFHATLNVANLPAGANLFYAVATDTNGGTVASTNMLLTVTNIPGVAWINFDDPALLDTSSGAVGGANLSNYLANFGVSISHVSPGTRLEAVGQNSFTGNNLPVPTSSPNFLRQVGSKSPVTFRLDLATNAQSVTFNRIGINTNGHAHVTHPAWTAELLNSSGGVIQEVSEPLLDSASNIPPRTFTLTASSANITSIKFNSDSQQIAAFGSVLLDDLFLNLPSTNPISIGVSVVGGGFQAPTNITFNATATDTATNIAYVGFYSGSTLIGVSSNSPYSFTWTNVLNGTYHIKAQLVDAAGYAQYSSSITVTVLPGGDILAVNFDSLNAAAAPVSGAPLASYLGSNAMTISTNSTGSTVVVENQAGIAGGDAVIASSISNLLTEIGPNGPMNFTVRFTTLLSQFGFTRPELVADPYVSHPAWTVRALGPRGRVLDSAQEPFIASFTNVPAQSYILNGPGIASVEFDSSGNGLSTFPAALLDDFILDGAMSVSVTNPADGQILTSLQVPIDTVTVDTNGTVTNVSFFFNGTNLAGTDQSSPYSITWTAPSNGNYVITAIASDTSGLVSTSAPVSIVVASGFAILTNPASQTVAVGSNVTFSITTTASNNVSYQWFANGGALSGQSGQLLTISNVQHSDAGIYMVVATSNGQSISNNPPASLAVIDPPIAAVPVLAPASPNIGDTVTLQEYATPTNGPIPFTYQWKLNGANIPGATNSIYTISNAQPLNSGDYRVVVGDIVAFSQSPPFDVAVNFGTNVPPTTNTTFETSLTFNPLVGPVGGINSNSPATGELAKIAGKKAGRFLWYNWTASFTGTISLTTMGSSFDTLMGVYVGTNINSLTNLAQDDDSGGFFTSLVTFNCTEGVTYSIAVAGYKGAAGNVVLGLPAANGFRVLSADTGNVIPQITQQPSNQIVNPGDTVTLNVTATNATSYQWFFNGGAVPGDDTNSLTISNFPPTAVGNYYVLAANAVGSVQSAAAVVQIAGQTNKGSSSTPDTITTDKFGDAVDLTTASVSHYRPSDSGGDVGGFTLSQSFSTLGATKEENEPNHAGQPGGASYWYAYTAPAGGNVQFDTEGSTFNTILAIYTGPGTSFGSLVNVGAAYTTNYVLDGQPVVLVSNVVAGTTFYIAVDGYLAASGAARLDVTLNPSPNSVNTNVPPITNNSVIVSIVAPVNNFLTTASNITVHGTVRGNGRGLGQTVVNISVNGNPPVAAALGNAAATTAWTLTNLVLTPGPNAITAQAFSQNSDGTTNASLPVERTVFFVSALPSPANKSTITLLTSGNGKISGVANNSSLEVNKIYKVTAVPAANWLFTNWTSGTSTNSMTELLPNAPQLSFVMMSNMILQANFVTNPFLPFVGSYNGLFASTNGATQDSSGFFTATIPPASKGTYSAKLMLDGGSYPFAGTFDLTGNTGTTLNRPGKSPVVVELHLNLATPDDQMTGSVIDGANPGWYSVLQSDRAVFNAKSNPATNYNGRFTVVFPPGTNAPTNDPGGFGYATLTNDTSGKVTLTGKLGDGTAISQSVPVSKDGYIPLYASLYSKQGTLLGWLEVTNNSSNSPAKSILGSGIAWIKLSGKGHAMYAGGFTNTNITVTGSFFVPPARGAQILPLLTNATLVISNGNLGTAMVYSNITVNGDKLVNPNTSTPLTGVITPSTGVLTLTFRGTGENHNTTASGVILPGDATTNAAGWFLGTNESGFFLLTQ